MDDSPHLDESSRLDDTPKPEDEQAKKDEFWFWVGVIAIALLVLSYLSEMFPVPWFED